MTERYKNGKIYKLVSDVSDDVYYGSTCLPLAKRLYAHKRDYKRYKRGMFNYVTSFKVLNHGLAHVDIILVEEYPCQNKMQLLKRERRYIESNDCVNKHIPCRTDAEYYEANKDKIKAYRETHKDRFKQWQSQIVYCSCGSNVRKCHIAKHKRTQKHKRFGKELLGLLATQERCFISIVNTSRQIKELLSRIEI